jgi:hypothetical protein
MMVPLNGPARGLPLRRRRAGAGPPVRSRAKRRFLLRGLPLLALLAACDATFSPILPSQLRFSVFGYLDASADTQWIRVTPVRPTILTSADPLGATVTLENLSTGRAVELRDSVFRYSPLDPDLGSEGMYAHNYWTAERIEPGATYRFSVAREGGPTSEAVVRIPTDYEAEVWLAQADRATSRGDVVSIVGLRHVALVRTTTYFHDRCGSGEGLTFSPIDPVDSDVQMIPISRALRTRLGCGVPEVERRELLVVGSGVAWPSDADFDASALGVPGPASNVENSPGFLAGVLTKLLPYEECEIDPPVVDYCQLRYDEKAATLTGTLRDALCGDAAVVGATVRLREIATPARIRSTTSGRDGEFRIGALEAGRRYALSIHRTILAGSATVEEYEEHDDTLEFAAGDRVAYDVGLHRLGACPAPSYASARSRTR